MSKKARNVVYVLNDEVPTDEAKDPIQERLDDVMRRKEASDQEFFPLEVVLIVCCALPATLLLLFGSLEATGVLTNGGIVGLFASGAVLTCCTVYCGGICYAAKSSNDRDFEQQLKRYKHHELKHSRLILN